MSAIEKKQFYKGQNVSKEDINAILDYTSDNIEQVLSTHLGYGLVTGFALTNEGGFALGVGAGLAYTNDGKRLVLEAGKQVDLTSLAPTVGTKTILMGMLQDFTPSEPTTDNEGNLVYTKLTETVKFVSGTSLASEVLPLASVELSSSGILIITSVAPIMEVAKATSERTKGFENSSDNLLLKGKSLIFSRPDGFEHDLINGVWRKPTFDTSKTEGYGKGDIIWLLPPDYGMLWTPPSTEVTYPWVMSADNPYNLLGKPKTYQAQTQFTLKAIRLMSTKDNNTDNPLTDKSCIGSSWIVDDPWAVIESGSNSLGDVLYLAGGKSHSFGSKSLSFSALSTAVSFTKPISVLSNVLTTPSITITSATGYWYVLSRITSSVNNLEFILREVVGSNSFNGKVSYMSIDLWYV